MEIGDRMDRILERAELLGVVVLFAGLAHSEALKSAGLILAVVALVARLATGYRPSWLGRPTVWAAGCVIATGGLSIAAAGPGLRHPHELISIASMVVLYALGIDVATTRRRVVALAGALLFGTAAGIAVTIWTPALRSGRFALPSLPNPIVAGEYLAAVLPVGLAIALTAGLRRSIRTAAAIVSAASAAALWLTLSRGPLPAAAMGLAVLLWLRLRRAWVALAVLLPALVLAVVVSVSAPSSRLVGERLENAVRIRTAIWSQTLERVRERPLTGHGLGTYDALRVEVDDGGGWRYTSHAHSVGLHLLAERGIIGLAAFAAFCVLAFRDILRALDRRGPASAFPSAASFAAAAALLTAGLSHLTVWAEPGMLFYAMLGIGTYGLRTEQGDEEPRETP